MEVFVLDTKFCPSCNALLEVEGSEIYNYDPIVFVEEVLYQCTQCGYKEKVEYLKQMS